jgi:putative spermidine/putrescine transport system substrate-binding protein
MNTKRLVACFLAAAAAAAFGGCSPSNSSDAKSSPAAKATSADDFGGLDKLVKAAKKEGAINLVSVAPDWANYGEITKKFSEKYGIRINSSNPQGTTQDEINAAQSLAGTDRAPDVFDLGLRDLKNTDLFAAYKVQTWNDIPAERKDASGLWYQDYGGYMSIGYDSSKVPEITSVKDLLGSKFKGKVALFADPTASNSALTAVQMVSLANGGTLSDVAKGIDFFAKMTDNGNFVPVAASTATVQNGSTPVILNWDYLAAPLKQIVPSWKVFIPQDAAIEGYYNAAINKGAAHPAAARLWMEFLYSDEGQNLFLKGGARPVRMDAMTKAGTIDTKYADLLPPAPASAQVSTPADVDKAREQLTARWAEAIK